MPLMEQANTRRTFLRLLAGIPLLSALPHRTFATESALFGRLIRESRAHAQLPERIEFISGALLGKKYRADTLIGGPKRPEVFVVREDAFDCVTFCEVVLAAANAHDMPEFETILRRIRYDRGEVQWRRRNHAFSDWCQRNIDNQTFRPVTMQPAVQIERTVTVLAALGRQQVSFPAIPRATFAANKSQFATGDVIGFVSRRSSLDYFHCGLVMVRKGGAVMLRHASLTHRRSLDENLETFLNSNQVKWVTLLRPVDQGPADRA